MASIEELKKMTASVAAVAGAGNSGEDIEITRINPDPSQPRKTFDSASLRELATSLGADGQVYPAIVHRVGAKYMLVDGERRWRAAKILGWKKMKCLVIKGEGARLAAMQLILNVERAEISPVEQAKFVFQMMTRLKLRQKVLSERFHKTPGDISKIVTVGRFLSSPPAHSDIPEMIASGRLVGMSVIYAAILADKARRTNDGDIRARTGNVNNSSGSNRVTRQAIQQSRGRGARQRDIAAAVPTKPQATTAVAVPPSVIKLEVGAKVECAGKIGGKALPKQVRVMRFQKDKNGDLLIVCR